MKIFLQQKRRWLSSMMLASLLFIVVAAPSIVYAQESCQNVQDSQGLENCVQENQIVKDLNVIINGLSIGVGLIIAGSLIFAGIQYMTGGQNSQSVSDAKRRITNSLIALFTYLLMVAFLQWLVPGGIFN